MKKELELLFGNFGLQSAAEMSRLIVEIQALALFTRSIDGAPGFLNPAIEPSRITVRRGGSEDRVERLRSRFGQADPGCP